MRTLPHTRSCFVCGAANAEGLRLTMETDGQLVRTRFTPAHGHVGFTHTIHGGILATVLDEVMAWVCIVRSRHLAYCAEMTVRFVQTAEPGQEIVATAELTANKRNRLFEASAELRDASGALLATATGKYLPIKGEVAAEFAADIEDPGEWKKLLQDPPDA
ncbi:MAG: PaaI family thioesterase [Verrucomicrobiota bacterium]